MVKKSNKRKHSVLENSEPNSSAVPLPSMRQSGEPIEKKKKWLNKQRVLIFASRGISHLHRHLMEDLKKLMPHHKPESKMERSKTLSVINEMCEMKNCNKALLFEGRKKKDLYIWLSNVPNGPSAKFLVENVYTMEELKLTGNCLRGSRPILSFDTTFNEKPHYAVLKELLTQTFGVPKHHPKSQPFFDHVYTFSILDNRIWFRNFQILSEDGALAEIGPRFVLNTVKIFSGSFSGQTLWENPSYVSPARYRQQVRLAAKNKYVNRVMQKVHQEATRPTDSYQLTPLDDIFKEQPLKKAQELVRQMKKESRQKEQDTEEQPLGTKPIKKVKGNSSAVSFKTKSKKVKGISKGKVSKKSKVSKTKTKKVNKVK